MTVLTLIGYIVILGTLVGAQQLMPVVVFAFIKPWQAEISLRAMMAFSLIGILTGGLLIAIVGEIIRWLVKRKGWKKLEKITGELGFGLALSTGIFLALEIFLLSVEKFPVLQNKKLLLAVLIADLLVAFLVGAVFYGAWKFYEQWIAKAAKIFFNLLGGGILLLTLILLSKKVIADHWPIKAAGSDKASVVWLTVDALRYDRFSPEYMPQVYGWFEERGYIFDKAYVPAPWTLPSFASMVTGEYPSQMRAELPMSEEKKDWELLAEKETVGESFKDLGYSTAAVVTNGWLTERRGFDQGFDYFVNLEETDVYDWGQVTQDSGMYKISKALGVEDKLRDWYRAWVRVRSDEPVFEVDGGLVIDEALRVKRRLQEPYFLWIHLIDPHGPYVPPEEFYPDTKGYSTQEIDKAEHMTDPQAPEELQELTVKLYDQLVAYSDQELYRFLAELEKGEEEPIIVFNSDHGEQFWENDGMIGHGHNLYEENVHVPLAIKMGKESEWDEKIEAVDLYELKNIMLAIIRGERIDFLGEDGQVLMEGRIEGPEQQAVINKDRWKLIEKKGRLELFHLLTDLEEEINWQAARYGLREKLNREVEDWQQSMKQENKEYDRKLKKRHAGESLPDVAGY